MSCDFGVWFPHQRLSNREAGELYVRLCESDISSIQPHPAVDAFYAELTGRHPEIDSVPDDRIDDHDYCPWSCALDRSPGHIIMPCVWSKADYVKGLVCELAAKHGLAVYDPQAERITYPDSAPPAAAQPQSWQFSCENRSNIPLPPAYTFAEAFDTLDAKASSFFILEHEARSYMQCGGSKTACSVELRVYEQDGSHKHYVVGHDTGANASIAIQMSAGVTNVREREVLSHLEAIELFESFFEGEPLPSGFSLRETPR